MIKKIAYENKVAIQNDEEIARKNKVTDEDLNEIKEVVNNNADELENKISKQEGKGLSSNDFTNELKTKLNNLENYDDTEVKQDIADLDTNKASKTELQEATIALQAELKATRKDLQAGTLEGQAEGESLYLQDSSDARFRSFGITGNSRQEKREGYNKLYLDTVKTGSINGVDYSIEDNKITLNGTTTQETDIYFVGSWGGTENPEKRKLTAGTYTMILKGPQKGNRFAVKMYCGTKEVMVLERINTNNYVQKAITEETYMSNIYITISGNMKLNNETFEIMVLEGEYTDQTAPEYEDFGAMPSLGFPSEVEAVGQDVNLFDKDNVTKINAYLDGDSKKITTNANARTLYIPCKTNKTYTILKKESARFGAGTCNVLPSNNVICNNAKVPNVGTEVSIETGNTDTYLCVFYYLSTADTLTEQEILDSIKIVEGTEINGYSPYGCGSANVTVCNKNRFVPELIENVAQARANVTIEKDTFVFNCTGNDMYLGNVADKGTKYYNGCGKLTSVKGLNTISVKLTNELFKKNYLSCFDKNLISLGVKQIDSNILNNYALPEGTEYVTLRFGIASPTAGTIYKTQVQIEEGDATDYTAHKEQTLTMPVQQEMLEGDTFDLDNEEEVHTWGKYVFTGEEQISKSGITNNNSFWMNSNFLPNLLNAEILNYTATDSITPNVLCTHLKTLKPILIVSYDNEGITICANDNNLTDITIRLGFGKSSEINTADKCKAWLKQQYEAGTPLTIYYKLATPTKLPFTEAQKTVAKQIEKTLHTYKGGTHVYCTDELSPIFNTRYTVDMQTAFNAINKEVINNV